MTKPPPPRKPPQRVSPAQLAALLAEIEKLRAEHSATQAAAQDAQAAAQETHDKVAAIHKALMVPQPGQTRSLLDRMAAVTISIESGERVGNWIVRGARVIAALGVIVAAFYAIVRFGHPPDAGGSR